MKEIIGNFWELFKDQNTKWDAICCTTNGVVKDNGQLVMGAGIAKDFAKYFPFLPKEWGQRLKSFSKRKGFYEGLFYPPILLRRCDFAWTYYSGYLVSFPTKNDWRAKSEISLICKSATSLVIVADALNWQNILLTRPGCGLGGLNWEKEVKPVISQYFDDRFTIVNKD